jgi:hypothetical protein
MDMERGGWLIIFLFVVAVAVMVAFSTSAFSENQSIKQINGASATGTTQPDVLVQYSNGVLVGYNATQNTNQSRGQALMNAVTNESANEIIYLGDTLPKSYNVSGLDPNQVDLTCENANVGMVEGTCSVSLHGAGKNRTMIIGGQSVINPGLLNSQITDLDVYDTCGSGCVPIDAEFDPNIINLTIRNIKINGTSGIIAYDMVFRSLNVITANVYNASLFSNQAGIEFGAATNSRLQVFDSVVKVIPPASTAFGIEFSVGSGNIIIVNTTINTTSSGAGYGFYTSGFIFNSIISTSGSPAYALYAHGGSGTIYITPSTVYVGGTSGTISNTLSSYGLYTYQRSPLAPPGNWVTVSNASTAIAANYTRKANQVSNTQGNGAVYALFILFIALAVAVILASIHSRRDK